MLPLCILALSIFWIAHVIFPQPSIIASSWWVVWVRRGFCWISLVTLLMIKWVDSEVSEMSIMAFWKDIVWLCGGCYLSWVDYAFPAWLYHAMVVASVSILEVPVVTVKLGVWILHIISTIKAHRINICCLIRESFCFLVTWVASHSLTRRGASPVIISLCRVYSLFTAF